MKTLKENYKRNLEIVKENMRRGMTASQVIKQADAWRSAFVRHNLYGEDEKAFINSVLALAEEETHLRVVEV